TDAEGRHAQALGGERPPEQVLLEQFHQALREGRPPEPGFEDAYRVLGWLRVAARSRAEGRRVAVSSNQGPWQPCANISTWPETQTLATKQFVQRQDDRGSLGSSRMRKRNMKPSDVRVGDRIRIIGIPGDGVPGYYLHRDTKRVFKKLIGRGRSVRIA